MIQNDYLVSYEGFCDPAESSCYVDCADDECTEEYYFTIVERPATEIYSLCGSDITDCEAANHCSTDSEECSVSYCDPDAGEDNCVSLTTTPI